MSFHRRFAFVSSLLLCSLSAFACSVTAPSGDVTESAAPATPDDGSTCAALPNVATEVPLIAVPSAPPAAGGGPIANGTYVATTATLFTGSGGTSGPTGKHVQMTVLIDGAHATTVFDAVTREATITRDGTNLHADSICPSKDTDDTAYTATPTTLSIYIVDSKGTRVYSLTKRPDGQ
jgi:hypothetical protein